MSDRPRSFILIGVDGGATRVRAHEVFVEAGPDGPRYRLGRAGAVREYPTMPFTPVAPARQFADLARGHITVTPAEVERGRVMADTIVDCVTSVAQSAEHRSPAKVRLGIGMPGLKTADGRGIAVMNNGPRMPDLAARLEAELAAAGVDLLEPILRLGSDGEYCGLGEQHDPDGLFRDVDHAYYLGGGTGLAEALKLRGSLVAFDSVRPWLAKAWEMQSEQRVTFEQLIPPAAINEQFRRMLEPDHRSATVSAANPVGDEKRFYPEEHAADDNPAARQVLAAAADAVAELIFERIETIYRGRRVLNRSGAALTRDSDNHSVIREHAHRGILLQRIVLGQHTGRLYDDPRIAAAFRYYIEGRLARRIDESGAARLRQEYLKGEQLRPGLILASRLPAAAALGAAVDAGQRSEYARTTGPDHP